MRAASALAIATTGVLAVPTPVLLPAAAASFDVWHAAGGNGNGNSKLAGTWDTTGLGDSISAVKNEIGLGGKNAPEGGGVGVALIDTGVTKVPGLQWSVEYGPDLSFESQDPTTQYKDNYAHGTHLAGIIAGMDPTTNFMGVAPWSEVFSVKVGAGNGAVDVVQVLAAIDWVIQHKNDDPNYPIRVLDLAYGTDGTSSGYQSSPLAFAVEQAWKAGIVVVVAGGNDGTTASSLVDPAYDPYVLSVGSYDDQGTSSYLDDTVSDFSSRGNSGRRVDLVAPGRSIVSLRDPGSWADTNFPGARVGDDLFKGSGTSQASAVVAGAVADLLQSRPTLTPDQVKAVLKGSARPMYMSDAGWGAGELNMTAALATKAPPAGTQTFTPATGTGTLDSARGSNHVTLDGVALTGDKDIFGQPFSTTAWASASASHTAWKNGVWMGVGWTGDGWTTVDGTPAWSGRAWSGRAWSGRSWSSATWG